MTFKDVYVDCSTGEFALILNSAGSDLEGDQGLKTAILISLFSDQRVSLNDLPDGESDRRGWWGDLIPDVPTDEIGSKLWTLMREKTTLELVPKIEDAAKKSLKWMVTDGVAKSVSVSAVLVLTDPTNGRVEMEINITKPSGGTDKYSVFWDNEGVGINGIY